MIRCRPRCHARPRWSARRMTGRSPSGRGTSANPTALNGSWHRPATDMPRSRWHRASARPRWPQRAAWHAGPGRGGAGRGRSRPPTRRADRRLAAAPPSAPGLRNSRGAPSSISPPEHPGGRPACPRLPRCAQDRPGLRCGALYQAGRSRRSSPASACTSSSGICHARGRSTPGRQRFRARRHERYSCRARRNGRRALGVPLTMVPNGRPRSPTDS
jgi:hypothetical protein